MRGNSCPQIDEILIKLECRLQIKLLFQAKNLLARNLTVSSPCTLMMCTVHLLQDRMASSTGRSWLSLSCDLR